MSELVPTTCGGPRCGHPSTEEISLPALLSEPAHAARRRRGTPKSPAPAATFASLGVPAPLVAALASAGITTPFPIQVATLPDALAGLDILGRGRTGSGKTLGSPLPL